MEITETHPLRDFDSRRPLETARSIPSRCYWDQALFQQEQREIFLKTWQWVGRREGLRSPGQFLTAKIGTEPTLSVCTSENEIVTFSNVCRHRGACVQAKQQGTAKFFQCRYHGWTYDLHGKLKGTPEFQGVLEFDKNAQALPRFHTSTFGPWVFVNASQPTVSLDDYLAPVAKEPGLIGFSDYQFVARREYSIRCNWKVFVDNYLDGGYHVNTLHPALGGVIDYSQYRTSIYGETALQTSPLSGVGGPADVRRGTAYYWWVFPNLMINVYEDTLDTNVVIPTGPEECIVLFDFYFRDIESPKAEAFIQKSMQVAHQVQLEDQEICEEVQQNLHSSNYDVGRFSVQREKAGYHFHQLLAKYLR